MAGEEEHPKAVGLEHSERIRCARELTEDFRVADEWDICRMQGFLVDRSRRDGIRLTAHGELDTLLNICKCSLAAHRLHHPVRKLRLIDIVKVDQVQDARAIIAVGRSFDNIDLKRCFDDADRILHDLLITDDDDICRLIYICQCASLSYDFRTYARRIADRYCYQRFLVFHNISSITQLY